MEKCGKSGKRYVSNLFAHMQNIIQSMNPENLKILLKWENMIK